ncbi:MAG: hypothetical protein DRJ47_04005 [Thermoprotei archaeon]|nr:MAG: hypothetical protein DRJ47_04005 [Thermoprotei archaeon]
MQAEYSKGLTWRSFIALLFAVILLEPAVIYYYFVSGETMPLSVWIIVLLWVEIASLFGVGMTQQEIFIMMTFEWVGLWSSTWFFVDLLKRFYFANSEIARLLEVTGVVPDFFAPVGVDALRIGYVRTFLDRAWILPVALLVLVTALEVVANISLGLFAYNLYGVVYKLEFPWASAQATIIETISEKKPREIRIFLLSFLAGLIYNFLSMFLPFTLGVEINSRVPVDLTPLTDMVFPGALAVFPLDLSQYILGFILPLEVTVIQLMGMIAFYMIGNHVITAYNMWPLEAKWKPGYNWLWIYQKSQIYFWLSAAIGLGMASAIAPMIFRYKKLQDAFKIMFKASRKGEVKGSIYLLLYLLSSLLSVLLVYVFVPDFPLWILLLLVVGWSFIVTMLQTYAAGVTIGFNVPYLKETVIYFSGYRRPLIWFAPMKIYTGGSMVAQHLKMAEILKCRTIDYIKAYILVVALGLLMSFIYVSLFWTAAPIPSSAYPYTVTGWPVEAVEFWRFQKWLWTGYMFRKDIILGSFIGGALIYTFTDFIVGKPHILIMTVAGILQPPTFTVAQFVGSLIGNKFIARHVGEHWSKVSAYMVMGFLIGDNSLRLLLMIIKLAGRSIWLLPY